MAARRGHSDAELLEMLRRRDAGEMYRDIARAMGKTMGQVAGALNKIDIALAQSADVPRDNCHIW